MIKTLSQLGMVWRKGLLLEEQLTKKPTVNKTLNCE